jgi:broad specificity phosphatase PhoE
VEQAGHVARELAELHLDAVYSSDLGRAAGTAGLIAEGRNLEVILDPAFREIDQGEWEGLHVSEIQKRWPDLWGPNRHFTTRPGGESPQHVRARALEGIRRIAEKHPDGTVVVVSHGGTIRWLSAEALGYDDRRAARIRGLGNGAVVSIEAQVDDESLVLRNLTRMDGNTPDLDDPND